MIRWCYTGDTAKAEEAFKPIRQVLAAADGLLPGRFRSRCCRACSTRLYPAGLQWYWKADFFQELSDKAIDLHVKYARASAQRALHDAPLPDQRRRAAGRRAGDTAFSFRDANFAEVIVGVDPDPANNPRLMQWAKDYWLALHPFSSGGGYINMMMDEGEDNVKTAYRDNFARLAQVKKKYDPSNLFRVNQNIKPG